MRFTKMHGAGNDYVYVNCFAEPFPKDPAALAIAVSDRHQGIGADGLILEACPELPQWIHESGVLARAMGRAA